MYNRVGIYNKNCTGSLHTPHKIDQMRGFPYTFIQRENSSYLSVTTVFTATSSYIGLFNHTNPILYYQVLSRPEIQKSISSRFFFPMSDQRETKLSIPSAFIVLNMTLVCFLNHLPTSHSDIFSVRTNFTSFQFFYNQGVVVAVNVLIFA